MQLFLNTFLLEPRLYEVATIARAGDGVCNSFRKFTANFIFFCFQITDKPVVSCTDKTGKVVTVCPYNSTCCESLYSSTGQGCCLTPQAVPCGDGKHCCPAGFECDPSCSIYMCSCREKM